MRNFPHMMKTDNSKYIYLRLQGVFAYSIKSEAKSESNFVSAISSVKQAFIGDDRENRTFFV